VSENLHPRAIGSDDVRQDLPLFVLSSVICPDLSGRTGFSQQMEVMTGVAQTPFFVAALLSLFLADRFGDGLVIVSAIAAACLLLLPFADI
jgi:hypothetical protein